MKRLKIRKLLLGIVLTLVALSPILCLLPMRRPVLELNGKTLYALTLRADEGGDIPAGLADVISGSYAAGEQIILLARAWEGYEFDHWETNLGHFDDALKVDAVFSMPARDVVVTAKFEKKG